MYHHGLYVQYPHLKRQKGFSTNHREPGVHTGGAEMTIDADMDIKLRGKKDYKYDIGLFQFDVQSRTASKHFYCLNGTLATFPVVNLYHQIVFNRTVLLETGLVIKE
jgi:hypothetical protein